MRTRTALLSALFALLPRLALAQAEPEKVELEEEPAAAPAKPAEEPSASPPAGEPNVAPQATTDQKAQAAAGGTTKAEGVVEMNAGAADSSADVEAGSAGTSAATRHGPAVGSGEWKFDFHGYFRAPMRLGI